MKLVRVLASVLVAAAVVRAQRADSAESAQDHGFPWIARSSVDAFYLAAPAAEGGSQPYQVSFYQGFTIQSLTFAWFHIGLRSRETLAPGFSEPYREPFELKLQSSVELLPDYLYVSLGGNIPIYGDTMAVADSLALYHAMNGYSPMPYSYFLSPRALQGAVFGRYAWTNWTLLGSLGYARPTLFHLMHDKAFFPAAYFDATGRAIYQTRGGRHRWDAKAVFYGDEGNDIRIPAHNEGDLYQIRYEYLKSFRSVAWQGGLGAAVKMPDANRRLKLPSELEPPDRDDNLQRAYLELSVAWAPNPDILWRAQLAPKALFTWNGSEIGHETEIGLGMGLKIWEYHRIRLAGTLIYGQLAGRTYSGFGVHGEFAFRHLGFQDVEAAADQGESE
jgi:hypothetical protein